MKELFEGYVYNYNYHHHHHLHPTQAILSAVAFSAQQKNTHEAGGPIISSD